LINRDSATRLAGRLGVESEVGELYPGSRSVRSREAVPSAHFWPALPVLWLVCTVHFEPSLSPGRWTAGPRFGINTADIAGRSHPLPNSIRKDQNERASHVLPWLTGTAPRGGLGVWVLSQK